MKSVTWISLFLTLGVFPAWAPAEVVLKGKTESRVKARVISPNKLIVTDDKGGWFEQGLEMQQLGGWDSPFDVSAQLRVVASNAVFQVRLDQPLEIRNQANPARLFRSPQVRLGGAGEEPKLLLVGQATEFRNPAPPGPGEESVGHYALAVSAYPPDGSFKETSGLYSGVLSMTFEPVARAVP